MQKVKTWYSCPAIPPPCQGIGCVVNTLVYYTYWEILYLFADALDMSIRRLPRAFYRVPTLNSPLI